uniref:hypothetical protein n=1 Tax=Bacillus sp. DX2.2 TaxID=3073452 RepID=UPI00402A6B7A
MFSVDISHNNNNIRLLTDSVDIYKEIYPRLYSIPGGMKNTSEKSADITIEFNHELISINRYGVENKIPIIYTKNEIYPVLFSVIYSYFFDIGSIGIHSVLVSKNNKNFLIIGDFGQGKTTLALELVRQGFKILSCDQTELRHYGDKILALSGSRLNKVSGNYNLIEEVIDAPRTLHAIYKVRGLSYKGETVFKKINGSTNKIFNIWPSVTWPWQNPRIAGTTNNLGWESIKVECFESCEKLSCLPQIELRGDPSILATKIAKE